jgi:2-methylcitrate dehydratase PrpD
VRYVVDPDDPYPTAYTGHVRVTLRDGRVLEERQPHIRGGVREPLSRDEIERKFRGNAAYGGWDEARANRLLRFARSVFDSSIDLGEFRGRPSTPEPAVE